MDRGFDNLPLVVADLRQPPRDIRALVAQSMLNDFLETGKMFRRALMLLAPYILSIGKWSVLSIVSITGIAYENIANTTSPTIWQYPSFVNGTSASTLPTFFLTLLMMGLKYQIAGEPRIRVHSLDRTTKFVCCVALVAVFFGAVSRGIIGTNAGYSILYIWDKQEPASTWTGLQADWKL